MLTSLFFVKERLQRALVQCILILIISSLAIQITGCNEKRSGSETEDEKTELYTFGETAGPVTCQDDIRAAVLAFDESKGVYLNLVEERIVALQRDIALMPFLDYVALIERNASICFDEISWRATVMYDDKITGINFPMYIARGYACDSVGKGERAQYVLLPSLHIVEPVESNSEFLFSDCRLKASHEILSVQ